MADLFSPTPQTSSNPFMSGTGPTAPTPPTPQGGPPATVEPTLPGLQGGGPATPQAIVTGKDATDHINNVIKPALATATTGIQDQATLKANQLVPQDPLAQAASSNIPYDQLMKSNPAAAFYRGYGHEPTPDELAKFTASNNPPPPPTSADELAGKIKDALGTTTDVNGNPTIPTPTTDPNSTESKLQAINDQEAADLKVENDKWDAMVQPIQDKLMQAMNGTLPLTTTEQAQINQMKAIFEQEKQAQKVANANFEGGMTNLQIARGTNRYAPDIAMGEIKQAVDQGIQKLVAIDQRMSQAISQMTSAFQKDDYNMLKDSYDMYSTMQQRKTDQITKMADQAYKFQKDMYDMRQDQEKARIAAEKVKYDEIQKPIQEMAATAAKFGAPKEVLDKINSATSVADAIQASVGYATDPTSPAGQYNAYVSKTNAEGGTPASAGDFLAAQEYAKAVKMSNLQVSQSLRIHAGQLAQTRASEGSGVAGNYISEVTKKPLTDSERAALGYADRMKTSSALIDEIGSKFTGQSSIIGGLLPNMLQTSDRQMFEQAKRDFVNAKLRKESGAAISPTEFASADKQYFPQAGDSADTLAQKQVNRDKVTANLYLEGGKPSLASVKIEKTPEQHLDKVTNAIANFRKDPKNDQMIRDFYLAGIKDPFIIAQKAGIVL